MYGRRVPKDDARVDAYGCVDEVNAALGLARVTVSDAFVAEQIYAVQKELIILMGELATAPEDLARYTKDGFRLTTSEMVDGLTAAIDNLEKDKLLHFKDWAIPGTTLAGGALDLARTTCRRAERRVATLARETKEFNREVLRYLNRLSDLCWLLERYVEKTASNSPKEKSA
jgi:cob(I)alamin adenosyltransferase